MRAGARCVAATRVVARGGRVRRMLGRGVRQIANRIRGGRRLTRGRRLGGSGSSRWANKRVDSARAAEAEPICAQSCRQTGRRASNRSEHRCCANRGGARRRFQRPTHRTIHGAVLGIGGSSRDSFEQVRRVRGRPRASRGNRGDRQECAGIPYQRKNR